MICLLCVFKRIHPIRPTRQAGRSGEQRGAGLRSGDTKQDDQYLQKIMTFVKTVTVWKLQPDWIGANRVDWNRESMGTSCAGSGWGRGGGDAPRLGGRLFALAAEGEGACGAQLMLCMRIRSVACFICRVQLPRGNSSEHHGDLN